MAHRIALAAAAAALCAGGAGCAVQRGIYTAPQLRAEVARRAPGIPPAEVVVPFDVGDAARARAQEIAGRLGTPQEKVRALVEAMFDPAAFGLAYASRVTGDAAETLRSREGNCLALASVFVGLARAVGLEARYMDASTRVHETVHGEDGITVSSGHVTAIVDVGKGSVGLDFARMGPVVWYRILDDVEALAHFYNNRGFERVDEARASGAPVDWEAAGADFRRAAQVLPGFARAWNNLGIAAEGAGREREAEGHFREATRRDPKLVAPRNNLGDLLLRRGDVAAAREVLEGAARLPSAGPHVLYNLALARLRSGDRAGAVAALRRASGDGYPRARRLLEQLSAPL
jgi:tetratricopeptide (TPR) repeat protein